MCDSSQEEFECKNVWLGDTGASAHMSMVKSGFKSLEKGMSKCVLWWMEMKLKQSRWENGKADTI